MSPYEAVEGVLRACAEHWIIITWIAVLIWIVTAKPKFEIEFADKEKEKKSQ